MIDTDAIDCPKGERECPIYNQIALLNQEIKSLQKQVVTDPLTGLFNKRQFNFSLSTEMERSRRSELPTSLILLDIDHFKTINDQYGHVLGDRVLEHFAQVLLKTLRMLDIACRYGGEEFAVILPSTPLLVAIQVAERLRDAFEKTKVENDGQPIHFTTSLGVSCYHHSQQCSASALVERADQQLYAAKQAGRNRVNAEVLGAPNSQLSIEERQALLTAADDH